MNQWFIRTQTEEGEIGPLRPSELLEQVRAGQVRRETLVRKDDSAWFAAGEVGGLFEAATKPDTKYFCPHCRKPVRKPPTVCDHCMLEVHQAIQQTIKHEIAGEEHSDSAAKRSIRNWLAKKKLKK